MNDLLATKIQKIYRGYLTRKLLRQNKDDFDSGDIYKLIQAYNNSVKTYTEFNKKTKGKNKKTRMPNLPEVISENIAKFAIQKKYKIAGSWNCVGDLKVLNKCIQVKGFTSLGPSSFGPKSKWDIIMFVDATKIQSLHFKVYILPISSNSSIWKNIYVNKLDTFEKQCIEKRRPRLTFTQIHSQLNNKIKLIFNGKYSELKI